MSVDRSSKPQQSPIDIVPSSTLHVCLPPDYLVISYPDTPLSGHFDHDFYFDTPPSLTFEGMSASLERIHIHARSEHLLNGQDFDFEIHFVHPLSSTIPETGEQRYLVLGVFFNEDSTSTTPKSIRALNELLKSNVGLLRKEARGDQPAPQGQVNPRDFLPSDTGRYFRYEGSLTTPNKDSTPNPEIVSWVVFPELVSVQPDDVAELKKHAQDTARQPQSLYRRFVLRSFV